MEKTKKIWINNKLINWDKAKVHILTHSLHYGGGAFEGIRFYNTAKGPAIFRLKEHTKRLFYSSKVLEMKHPYSQTQINEAIIKTVKVNKVKSGYIRPLVFFDYGIMGLWPKNAPVSVTIACWPWGKYLGGDTVKVKISKYIRIHPDSSITDAKLCGHYVNSILASLETHNKKYDEALFLDFKGNIAEGPGENFFLVKKDTLYTPKLGTILGGITRESIMIMAKDLGFNVKEQTIKPSELKNANECFFTGTAAEVTGISKINDLKIGNGKLGKITSLIKDEYLKIVSGENIKYEKWLTYIN